MNLYFNFKERDYQQMSFFENQQSFLYTNLYIYKIVYITCSALQRRPVLLIDNIGLVFNRLRDNSNNQVQWALRKILCGNGVPIFVNAGPTVIYGLTIISDH